MKSILTTIFAISSLTSFEVSAANLKGLHTSVKIRVEKYCPQEITKADIDALRTDEIIKIDGVDYYAEEKKKVPAIEEETLTLCSGKYAQNRSNSGRVDCSFCKEGNTKRAILSVTMHVTKKVDETLAKRVRDTEVEVSASPVETTQATKAHG